MADGGGKARDGAGARGGTGAAARGEGAGGPPAFSGPAGLLGEEDEVAVGLPPAVAAAAAPPGAAAAADLSGIAKAWFAIGPGRSGKTTLLRWAAEAMAAEGRAAVVAALDPQNRSLAGFLDGVAEPPTSDAAGVTRWLEALLRHCMDRRASALLDLGGGDTSLGRLLADVPDLAAALEAAGVAPVAVYTLGPRVDDLASLASFEGRGFRPRATALVLNEGLADPSAPREESFARVLRHSAFRSAVERGALPLWMPRLEPAVAAEVEAKRLHFADARDGRAPEGRPRVAPLGAFDRSRLRRWLEGMDGALAPLRGSWLP